MYVYNEELVEIAEILTTALKPIRIKVEFLSREDATGP